MKKAVQFVVVVLAMLSCKDNYQTGPTKGQVQFSMSPPSASAIGGRVSATGTPALVVLTITDANDVVVVQDKVLQLFTFGQGYSSESLELKPGDYKLTQFIVTDASNTVLYVAPKVGSKQAKYVQKPLPISFTITKDGTTFISPEVLAVDKDESPQDFGYAVFGLNIVPHYKDINLTFLSSITPAYYETDGYDSVVVTFSTPSKSVRKSLHLISPVEGKGTLSPGDLGFAGQNLPVNVEIHAYSEVKIPVPQNIQINEMTSTGSFTLSSDITEIKLGQKLNLIGTQDTKTEPLQWQNYAHVKDKAGTFYMKVKNDICDSYFEYTLFKTSTYSYYYKELYYVDLDTANTIVELAWKHKENYTTLSPGKYIDNVTFQNMCPASKDHTYHAGLYFSPYGDNLYWYLDWEEEDAPLDPQQASNSIMPTKGFILTAGKPNTNGRIAGKE